MTADPTAPDISAAPSDSVASADAAYAVVDVETTGLDRAHDRVLEIAIIQLDEGLNQVGHWRCLVNPQRPASAVEIHGITDDDLADAPTFRELAGTVAGLLRGRKVVAHNVEFDRAFLNREFAAAGSALHIPAAASVCTMDQSRIYLPPGPHSLYGLADRVGLKIHDRHRALADAELSAALLRYYVQLESAGERYTNRALNRQQELVLPAQWERATPLKLYSR